MVSCGVPVPRRSVPATPSRTAKEAFTGFVPGGGEGVGRLRGVRGCGGDRKGVQELDGGADLQIPRLPEALQPIQRKTLGAEQGSRDPGVEGGLVQRSSQGKGVGEARHADLRQPAPHVLHEAGKGLARVGSLQRKIRQLREQAGEGPEERVALLDRRSARAAFGGVRARRAVARDGVAGGGKGGLVLVQKRSAGRPGGRQTRVRPHGGVRQLRVELALHHREGCAHRQPPEHAQPEAERHAAHMGGEQVAGGSEVHLERRILEHGAQASFGQRDDEQLVRSQRVAGEAPSQGFDLLDLGAPFGPQTEALVPRDVVRVDVETQVAGRDHRSADELSAGGDRRQKSREKRQQPADEGLNPG